MEIIKNLLYEIEKYMKDLFFSLFVITFINIYGPLCNFDIFYFLSFRIR